MPIVYSSYHFQKCIPRTKRFSGSEGHKDWYHDRGYNLRWRCYSGCRYSSYREHYSFGQELRKDSLLGGEHVLLRGGYRGRHRDDDGDGGFAVGAAAAAHGAHGAGEHGRHAAQAHAVPLPGPHWCRTRTWWRWSHWTTHLLYLPSWISWQAALCNHGYVQGFWSLYLKDSRNHQHKLFWP